jgi:exopolyphosphatase/guanosine-5'-triphosphate,3'-diphosphate pyrophosphatase
MTETPASPAPEMVAAIDLGSNSFHMIVCRVDQGQVQVVDRMREMVRLAAGLDDKKNLSEEAQQRALECLERFGQRIAGLPRGSVRAVGTNTLRTARTTGNFLKQAKKALGHPIQIISGVEEARIIYLGVAHSTAADERKRLVIDIGGGSTELIIGKDFTPKQKESLYMGCVSMSRRFFADGVIDKKRIQKAELAALQELEPHITRYRTGRWELAIGSSGTAKAIAKVVQANGWCEEGISREAFKKLIGEMKAAGHMDKLTLAGLSDDRRPVFAGGAVILYACFKALGIEHMQVSEGSLREGLIHDLLGRIQHEDVRELTVRSLAERYHVDLEQVARVQACLRDLYGQVAKDWALDEVDGLAWLLWAAALYEIGLDIAHSGYHKHGAYIVANADLSGLSRQEQALLAALVRCHRRKFSQKTIKALAEEWQQPAQRLAMLLRLAVTLQRSRQDDALPSFGLRAEADGLRLTMAEGWQDEHKLLHADLEQEAAYLEQAGLSLRFD